MRVRHVVDAKVVKCGKFSTCASTGAGSNHRLVCWGNVLQAADERFTSAHNMSWPSPSLISLPGEQPLKEGAHTFSIGSHTGSSLSHFCCTLHYVRAYSAGCAIIASNPTMSQLWCWGDVTLGTTIDRSSSLYTESIIPIAGNPAAGLLPHFAASSCPRDVLLCVLSCCGCVSCLRCR